MKFFPIGVLALVITPQCSLAQSPNASTTNIELTYRAQSDGGSYIEIVRETEEKVGASPLGPERVSNFTQLRGVWRDLKQVSSEPRIKLILTFDRVKIVADLMGRPVQYDSDTADEEESTGRAAAIGRPMLGKKLTFNLAADGKVEGVEGMDDLLDAVEESAVGNFLFAGAQNEFDDEAAAFTWVNARLAPLPGKEVSIGDKWTAVVRQEDLYTGSLVYEYECTLAERSEVAGRDVAKITYTGKVVRPSDARAGTRIFNIAKTFKSGEFSGHALYDIQRGEVVSQLTVYDLSFACAMMIGSLDEPAEFSIDDKITETYTVMTRLDRTKQHEANLKVTSQPAEKTDPAE